MKYRIDRSDIRTVAKVTLSRKRELDSYRPETPTFGAGEVTRHLHDRRSKRAPREPFTATMCMPGTCQNFVSPVRYCRAHPAPASHIFRSFDQISQ